MAVVNVTDLHAGAVTGETTGPSAGQATLVGQGHSGLFWSMNCDSWLVPKNSFIAADRDGC